jgi:hypothetical protein
MSYVMKCLTEGTWDANECELKKFNLANTMMLFCSPTRVSWWCLV